ncbi:hypothetical protein GLOTRDRAFT_94484 [Gloeophyllum trabeum ATCC 11539]|uniref:Uncharacterized protein n=1 Tax=Gloeophyllum trabeum (strain ATCC 11539 / FP-39264 / Madison 617) TaxID=670483 RepID=S7RIG8_GLOTA|nr:uncharacterized protein GLOTRDRAFT_94484 [Gloeophyllum trabeum ATCC 11539]EPQ54115.1 hypothetical protein GLOTRDRAFT_94484 [Gloeophyllum trabeum ATCC 11539]
MATPPALHDFPRMIQDFNVGLVTFWATDTILVSFTHSQVAAFWSFQTLLHSFDLPDIVTNPSGYSTFALYYNQNLGKSRMPVFDPETGDIKVLGPDLPLSYLIGDKPRGTIDPTLILTPAQCNGNFEHGLNMIDQQNKTRRIINQKHSECEENHKL